MAVYSAGGACMEGSMASAALTLPKPMPAGSPAVLSAEVSERDLSPDLFEVAALALTLVTGLVGLTYEAAVDGLNVLVPMMLTTAMIYGSIRMLRRGAENLWTPVVWLRTAVAVFFGIGSLVPLFAGDDARTYTESLFLFFPLDILKFNLVCVAFVLTILLTVGVGEWFSHRSGRKPLFAPKTSVLSLPTLGGLFLGVGSFVQLVLIMPSQLGLNAIVWPAAVSEVGMTVYVGIYFLSNWAFRRGDYMIGVMLVITVFYMVLGLLSLSKTSVLLPVILFLLGYIVSKPTLGRIILAFSLVSLTFFLSNNVVQAGRFEIYQRYGSLGGAGISERIDMLRSIQSTKEVQVGGEVNFALIRLSYTNAGTYVIAQYDNGIPGSSLSNAFYTMIPRVVWPGKPIITDIARELSYATTGIFENSITPSMPADAYWNQGWIGVALWGVIAGLIFWGWSCYSIAVLRAEAWHLFPILLIGARLGTTVAGFLVSDLIGPLPVAIAGHFALVGANALIRQRR